MKNVLILFAFLVGIASPLLAQTDYVVGAQDVLTITVFGEAELYRLPGTKAYTRTILTSSAAGGVYTYKDTSGTIHNVNLYSLAAGATARIKRLTIAGQGAAIAAALEKIVPPKTKAHRFRPDDKLLQFLESL